MNRFFLSALVLFAACAQSNSNSTTAGTTGSTGSSGTPVCPGPSCDADGDGAPAYADCDDVSAACSTDCGSFYRDADGDARGSGASVKACAAAAGFVLENGDCDDEDAEHWLDCGRCIDQDGDAHGNNCDLGLDCDDTIETGATCSTACGAFYADGDGDGLGVGAALSSCFAGAGFVASSGDCDDAFDTGAACKNGCVQRYRDTDADGVGAGAASARCPVSPGYTATGTDCDDTTVSGAACSSACVNVYVDADGDTFGAGGALARCAASAGLVGNGTDCDDSPTGATCNNTCARFYPDTDGDGTGDGMVTAPLCVAPANHAATTGDCAPMDASHWSDCGVCMDATNDDDDRGPGCDLGADCDNANPEVWVSCASCLDYDADGYKVGCDAFLTPTQADCDDRDPLTYPSAVDLPDTGVFEDCQAGEPLAASGTGIYVNAATGCTGGNGSKATPFCDLEAANSAASATDSIFITGGETTPPQFIDNRRIFGGYTAPAWNRAVSNPTVLRSSYNNFGTILGNTVMQGVTIEFDNDGDNHSALNLYQGSSIIADMIIRHNGTSTDCSNLYISGGAATVVRVTVAGSLCANHFGVFLNQGTTARFWDVDINAGAPGAAGFPMGINAVIADVRVQQSRVTVRGALPRGIVASNGSLFMSNSTVSVIGSALRADTIVCDGATLNVQNSLLQAIGATQANSAVNAFGGTVTFHNNNIVAGASDAPRGVGLFNNGLGNFTNNIFSIATATNTGSANALVFDGGTTGALRNNSIVGGAGTFCPLNANGTCIADLADVNDCSWFGCSASSGNFFTDCMSGPLGQITAASACVNTGFALTGQVRFDYEDDVRPTGQSGGTGPLLWDVGRDEYVTP